MDTPDINLAYEQATPPWFRQRRWQRRLLGCAAGVAVLCGLYALKPAWGRYRFHRLQQGIVAKPWMPAGVVARFSTTQPYAYAPGAFDRWNAEFWTARGREGLGSFTVGLSSGVAATPVFSGVLQTAAGRRRLVQFYATPAAGALRGMSIVAVSAELHGWRWVGLGNRSGSNTSDVWFGSFASAPLGFREATVFAAALNAADPSEVDIRFAIDGKSVSVPFHVVDYPKVEAHPPSDGRVQIAAPLKDIWKSLPEGNGYWSFLAWPYTGKT